MNIIKTGSLQISGRVSKEKIAILTENFENYLNKNYKIIAKLPNPEGNAAMRKNFQILYYLQHKKR